MASSIDVMLYLGWDNEKSQEELHEYITAELPIEVAATQGGGESSGQHLTQVSGCVISPDLAGSAQAGNLRVYCAIIRRGRSDALIDYLEKAPWRSYSGILIVKCEDFEETIVQFTNSGPRFIQDGKFIF